MQDARQRRWTDAELAQLDARYPFEGPRKLAVDLERSQAAVCWMACKRGLVRRLAWTCAKQREAARLKAAGVPIVAIARQFGRSASAVSAQLRKMERAA